MEVFVSAPWFRSCSVSLSSGACIRDVVDSLLNNKGVPSLDFYVTNNGRLSDLDDQVQDGAIYHLEPRLCGGKGGFGSMLRALGAQIEKTTNREACRDLSGRRLRDVNHEKEMAEWLKKQAEREAEKEQRRLERLKRKLAEPKHKFTDPEYQQQCHDLSERLEDSVLKGMQASSSGLVDVEEGPSTKRPNPNKEQPPRKKKCFWTGVGDLDYLVSSEEEEESDEEEESPSSSVSSCEASGSRPAPSQSGSGPGPEPEPEPEPEPGQGTSPSPASVCSSSSEPGRTEASPTEVQSRQPGEDQHGSSSGSSAAEDLLPGCSSLESHSTLSSSAPQPAAGPMDLDSVASAQALEALGLEVLKAELMSRGLKCGGTLMERAARLFSVKGLSPDQIDPALLAKAGKGKRK